MSWVEAAKRAAVAKALEEVRNVQVVGIGSGTTIELLVPELAKLIKREGLELNLVPTSRQIETVLADAGLTGVSPNDVSQIDLALDGADQVESETLHLIKGGGAALTREKIVDSAAKKLIVVIDERKLASTLGNGQVVPVETMPFGYKLVMRQLVDLDGKPELRRGRESDPIMTDNGNFVIDVDFGPIKDAHALDERLKSIPGLVETGLFLDLTDRVYVGLRDGRVKILESR